MTPSLSSLTSAVSTLAQDARFVVTVIGAAVAAANEVLPLVPTQWQHWVTAAVAAGTVLARDTTDVLADVTKVDPTPAPAPNPVATVVTDAENVVNQVITDFKK